MPSCPGVPQAWYSLNLAWSHHSPWPRINDLFLVIVHLDQDLARVQLLYQRGRTVLFYQEKLPIVFLDVNDLKNSLNLKIQQINSIGWEMLRIHKVLHFQRWRKSQAKSLLAGSIRQPASCCWILLSKPQGSPRYTQLSSKSTSLAWCANVHCDMSSWSQEGQWSKNLPMTTLATSSYPFVASSVHRQLIHAFYLGTSRSSTWSWTEPKPNN